VGSSVAFSNALPGSTVLQPARAERKLATKAEADKAGDFKRQAWEPTGFHDELMASNRAIRGRRRGQLEEQFKGGGFGAQGEVQVQQAF
jgi:hypothetical protein